MTLVVVGTGLVILAGIAFTIGVAKRARLERRFTPEERAERQRESAASRRDSEAKRSDTGARNGAASAAAQSQNRQF